MGRIMYACPNENSVFPLDRKLKLASRKFSDGIEQRVAIEASKTVLNLLLKMHLKRHFKELLNKKECGLYLSMGILTN